MVVALSAAKCYDKQPTVGLSKPTLLNRIPEALMSMAYPVMRVLGELRCQCRYQRIMAKQLVMNAKT